MATFHSRSSLSSVLAQADARAVIDAIAPEVAESPLAQGETPFPIGRVLPVILDDDDPRVAEILDRIVAIEDRTPRPAEAPALHADPEYEAPDVTEGSARVDPIAAGAVHRRSEIVLHGPQHGNPFVDVELTAAFTLDDRTIEVGGFYDGDGRYLIRFLPPQAGVWAFVTGSTARSLDGIHGTLTVEASDEPGPVRVSDTFHFAHADGTPFVPLGTTAYAWTHQSESLQEQTLRSLESAPFTKLRMGLFPKHFLYNANEPERFVFPRAADGWDTTRFDLEYFRRLEHRIDQLRDLGIEADLILFHPYDRWGFSHLGRAADDRYISYVVRRLSAFANVWWSLANEYDLLLYKQPEDWDRIAGIVRANDPVGHPLSIHNWFDVWDYSSDWATHCSIQHGENLPSRVREWRRRWEKPVVVDECGYEGDLDQGWGFLTAEEEVRRIWDVTLSGGYGTHGETFYSEDDVIFWAKGGTLRGDSPARLRFLRSIVEESPTGVVDPLRSDFDTVVGGVEGSYVVVYFGGGRPRLRTVNIPSGMTARVDVIDTWNMTIEEVPGVHAGDLRVDLPARPYMAIRLRAA